MPTPRPPHTFTPNELLALTEGATHEPTRDEPITALVWLVDLLDCEAPAVHLWMSDDPEAGTQRRAYLARFAKHGNVLQIRQYTLYASGAVRLSGVRGASFSGAGGFPGEP